MLGTLIGVLRVLGSFYGGICLSCTSLSALLMITFFIFPLLFWRSPHSKLIMVWDKWLCLSVFFLVYRTMRDSILLDGIS
jgi:hypothetical protein